MYMNNVLNLKKKIVKYLENVVLTINKARLSLTWHLKNHLSLSIMQDLEQV